MNGNGITKFHPPNGRQEVWEYLNPLKTPLLQDLLSFFLMAQISVLGSHGGGGDQDSSSLGESSVLGGPPSLLPGTARLSRVCAEATPLVQLIQADQAGFTVYSL